VKSPPGVATSTASFSDPPSATKVLVAVVEPAVGPTFRTCTGGPQRTDRGRSRTDKCFACLHPAHPAADPGQRLRLTSGPGRGSAGTRGPRSPHRGSLGQNEEASTPGRRGSRRPGQAELRRFRSRASPKPLRHHERVGHTRLGVAPLAISVPEPRASAWCEPARGSFAPARPTKQRHEIGIERPSRRGTRFTAVGEALDVGDASLEQVAVSGSTDATRAPWASSNAAERSTRTAGRELGADQSGSRAGPRQVRRRHAHVDHGDVRLLRADLAQRPPPSPAWPTPSKPTSPAVARSLEQKHGVVGDHHADAVVRSALFFDGSHTLMRAQVAQELSISRARSRRAEGGDSAVVAPSSAGLP